MQLRPILVPIRRAATKLGAFGLTMVTTMAASLLSFPIVITVAGATIWGEIALAQAIAAVAGVGVAWGWGVLGPATVAGLPTDQRGAYYAQSLVLRGALFTLATPVLAIVAWFVFDQSKLIGFAAALSALTTVLGGGWFYVGEGRPWRLFAIVTTPTVAGVVVGAGLTIILQSALAFVVSQLIAAVIGVLASSLDILRRHRVRRSDLRPQVLLASLIANSSGVLLTATSALYVNVPLMVVNAIAPWSTASYAMADKLYKMARTATGVVSQVTQGYVPAGSDEGRLRRIKRALGLAAVTAVAAGIAYLSLSPVASSVLSVGRISIDPLVAAALAVALAAVCVSSIVGLSILIALGRIRDVAVSTVVGATVGSVGMLSLGSILGVAGVAIAVSAAELIVLVYQLLALGRTLRDREYLLHKAPI